MNIYNDIVEGKIEQLSADISLDIFKSARKTEEGQKKAFTFTIYSLMQVLDISLEDALDSMTDGSNDWNIDAVHISEESETSWSVSFFQTKYFQPHDPSKLANKMIGESDITEVISNVKHILNGLLIKANPRVQEKIIEIKTKVREMGIAPNIYIYIVSNGSNEISNRSKAEIECIESEKENARVFVKNSADIVPKSKKKEPISYDITSSKEVLEVNVSNVRGIVCSISLLELMKMYDACGQEQLLIHNIRGFLNWVKINKDIKDTAVSDTYSKYFWFFNNGISIICQALNLKDDFHGNKIITLREPQIINGGQTTRSIYEAYKLDHNSIQKDATVLVRLYQTEDKNLITYITKNTNSQSAINYRDLQSNNDTQGEIQEYFETQGYYLDIKRDKSRNINHLISISNENLFQIYASLYLDLPHKAKSSKTFIFKTVFGHIQDTRTSPKTLLRAYKLWENIPSNNFDRDSEEYLIMSYAKYSILYTMKKIEPKIIDISENIDISIIGNLYKKTLEIIKKIIQQEKENKQKTGNTYSHANLFKSARSTELIDEYFIEHGGL